MKLILGSLLFALLVVTAQAADFQAVQGGDLNDTNTWGGVTIPGASDNVDLNGQAVTLTNTLTLASLVDVATGGSLDLGAGVTFTCRSVTDAALITSAAGVVVDCDVTLTTGNGLTINAFGEVTIQGTWDNSGGGYCVYNSGTVTDFSGELNNSSDGYGAFNGGTWYDFSGSIENSSSGYGAYNYGGTWYDFSGTLTTSSGYGAYNYSGTWSDFSGELTNSGSPGDFSGAINYGTWSDFSGILNNSGSYGALNNGTWTDFSGILNNSGSGMGAYNVNTWFQFSGELNNSGSGYGVYNNGGTWTDFSGNLVLSSADVEAIDGDAIPFSGSIKIAAQPDLSAANVKQGKTNLGVDGSLVATTYGDNDASKVLITASNPGTFNESARNTDPGIANVKSGTGYKIINTNKTGTLVAGGGWGFGGGTFTP